MSGKRLISKPIIALGVLVLVAGGAFIYFLSSASASDIPIKVTRSQEKVAKSPFAEPTEPEPFNQPKEWWSPRNDRFWREMQELHQRFNKLFEENFSELPNLEIQPMFPAMPKGAFLPDTDLRDTDHALIVTMDLPGMEKGDIDVHLKDNVLTVKGKREESAEFKNTEKGLYKQERRMGAFERQILLPDYIDQNNVKASYDKGVLTITIGKKANAPKVEGEKITIE